jgi:methyl-accepting chemotaxis protein
MRMKFSKKSLIWKFTLQNIIISLVLGVLIWHMFNAMFRDQVQSMIEKDMFNKLKIIGKLLDNYQKRLREYDEFQKKVIRKMLLNTAEDFYITARSYYRDAKRRKLSIRQAKARAWNILKQKTIGKTGYIYILNSKGEVLYHPQQALVGENFNIPRKKYDFIRFQMKNARKNGEKAFIEYEWRNPGEEKWRPKVLGQIYFEPWDWIISVSSYKVEFDVIVDPVFEKKLFEGLKKQIMEIEIGETGYPFIVASKDIVLEDVEGNVVETHKKGEVIIHKDPTVERKQIFEVHREVANEMFSRKKGFLEYRYRDQKKIMAFQSYPDFNWIIAVSAYSNEYFIEYQQELTGTVIALILAFLVLNLVLTSVFFYSGVIRVIKKVRIKLNSVAQGNLNIKRTQPKSSDNIGLMIVSINNMVGKLEHLVVNIHQSIQDISGAIGQVSQGNIDLSQRSEKQAAALEELGSSMEEFSSIVKSNTENADRAAELSREAKLSAEKGGEVVYQAVEMMQEVGASSHEIENITHIIEEIAFQTNLLALNASVEAARAGEYGKGTWRKTPRCSLRKSTT